MRQFQDGNRVLGVLAIAASGLAATAIAPSMARAQESMASVGAASSMSSSMSNMGGTSVTPGGATSGVPGAGGAGGTSTTTTTTTVVRRQPFRSSRSSGEDFLNELMSAPRPPRAIPETRRRSPRAQAAYARRLSRMTAAQRSRMVSAKYKKPAVGWLAYYLPQDRFKVTSQNWRYVSIEDDNRAYPMRYYFRPSSPSMLALLSRSQRGLPRYNRVIGFHTWQDAMIAGYRPDPVSRPEPAAQIADLARVARGPQLARYVEFVYAGQVSPQAFGASYSYLRQVERAVARRRDTRPLVRQTVIQALAAVMGEGDIPRTVGGTPRTATAVATTPAIPSPTINATANNAAPTNALPPAPPTPTAQSSGGDKRAEDFDNFRNRAGNLAAKR